MSATLTSLPISKVLLRGTKMVARVEESTTQASIDLSVDAVSQLTVTYLDPDLTTLRSRSVHKGASLTYEDWKFVVASMDLGQSGGVPQVTVTGRSAIAQALRNDRGALVQSNVSPTTFIERLVRKADGKFVGQPSPSRKNVAREGLTATATPGSQPESTWECAVRFAQQLGYVVFEDRGTVYFGKPTWLMKRATSATVIRYPKARSASELETFSSVPTLRTSDDTTKHRVTGTVELEQNEAAAKIVPGAKIELKGIPQFDAEYFVTKVGYSLDGISPVVVDFETPVDPEPQPAVAPGDGDDSATPAPGVATTDSPVPGGTSPLGYQWPTTGTISSGYGMRNGRLHKGLDIAAPTGTRVVATRDGTVKYGGWASGYGNVIYLDHGNGVETRYAHLSNRAVTHGQRVSKGQVIGFVGSTGRSSGPHLHFEIRFNGDARDPRGYLASGAAPASWPGGVQ